MVLRIVLMAVLLCATSLHPAAALNNGSKPAAAAPAAKSDSEALRADMEGQVARLKLEVETFMAVQDKRIGDLTYYANFNNGLIAFLATAIAVAVAVIGFRFPKMAVQEAKKVVDDWVGQEGKRHLDAQFKRFQAEMAEKFKADLKRALDDFRDEVAPHIEKVQATVELAQRWSTARKESEGVDELPDLAAIINDPNRMREAASLATAKPQEKRTFDDWYVLALYALNSGENEVAAPRFLRAAACGHSSPEALAQVYYDAALAWNVLGKGEQALAALDEIDKVAPKVEGYGKMARIRAEAGYQRAYELDSLGRLDEAMAAYERQIGEMSRFAQHDKIRQPLVRSRLNLAVLKESQEGSIAALKAYDEIIALYDKDKDEDIQISVAMAIYNRANRLRSLGHNDEALYALETFLGRFNQSTASELVPLIENARTQLEVMKAEVSPTGLDVAVETVD